MKNTFWLGHRTHMFLLAVLLLGAGSCKKVKDTFSLKLPDATQDGKNTFGCLLDGNVWVPLSDHTALSALKGTLSSTGLFMLTASDDHGDADGYDEFRLALDAGPLKPGVYTLNSGFAASYSTRDNFNKTDAFSAGPTSQATITITKVEPRTTTFGNATSRFTVVAGTFSFTAASPTTNKIIVVQEGRFDVQVF